MKQYKFIAVILFLFLTLYFLFPASLSLGKQMESKISPEYHSLTSIHNQFCQGIYHKSHKTHSAIYDSNITYSTLILSATDLDKINGEVSENLPDEFKRLLAVNVHGKQVCFKDKEIGSVYSNLALNTGQQLDERNVVKLE